MSRDGQAYLDAIEELMNENLNDDVLRVYTWIELSNSKEIDLDFQLNLVNTIEVGCQVMICGKFIFKTKRIMITLYFE